MDNMTAPIGADEQKLTGDALALASTVRTEIATQEDYSQAAEVLKQVKGMAAKLEAKRKELTGPLLAIKAKIDGFFKEPIDKLAAVEKALKAGVGGYLAREEEKRQAEQHRLQAEADAKAEEERKRLQAEADAKAKAEKDRLLAEARKADTPEAKAALKEQAKATAAPVVQVEAAKVEVKSTVAPVKGVSTRTVWHYEVTDFAALPDGYKVKNDALLNDTVKKLGGDTLIPGVRVWSEQTVVGAKG